MTMRRRCGGVPGAAPPSRARASVDDAIRAPSRIAGVVSRARARWVVGAAWAVRARDTTRWDVRGKFWGDARRA